MKAYLLVVALAVAPACGKKNDVAVLEHEVVTLAKYHQLKLDSVDKRIQEIMKRGQTIPADFPGVKEVGQQLQEARDTAAKLRGMVGASGQKGAVETQAEAAAKEGRVDQLEKLVHDAETAIDDGMTIINADLGAVERWIFNYDNKTLALVAPAKEQPAQPEQPATPPAPAPEQGSAAAPAPQQGSAAAPAPKQGSAAPVQPKP
jgi:hypothetical protein